MRTIAVLGGGKDSLGILRRIKEMGFRTLVFDGDEEAPAREYLADHFVNISCYDTWHICDYLSRRPDIQFQGVVGGGTDTPDVASCILFARDIPGIKSRTAEISKNKWMQKKLFSEAGIQVPDWTAGSTCSTPNDEVDAVVVKPVSNRGSRGVVRVTEGEFIPDAVEYAKQFDPRGHTIIEEWIDGIQLSSESLVQDGKIIYTAYSQRNYARLEETHPYVIEDGGDMPPYMPFYYENNHERKAHEQLQKCVVTMGLRSGTLKGDLVWDGHNIWVIEVACRLSGGDFCSKQIPEVWGVDFVGYAVKLSLGETIYPGEIRPYFRRYMCQRFVIPHGTTCHAERGPGFIRYGKSRQQTVAAVKKDVKNAS